MDPIGQFLLNGVNDFEKFFTNQPPAVQTAAAPLVAAGQAAVAALPGVLAPIARTAVDSALMSIPGNSPFVGLEDAFLQALAAEAMSRLSAETQAALAAQPPSLSPPLSGNAVNIATALKNG